MCACGGPLDVQDVRPELCLSPAARFPRGVSAQRVGEGLPLPAAPGEEPEPASFAPVVFEVPDRLLSPVDWPLPAAPGEEPAPASFGPVLFTVPDRLVPEVPPSAARAAEPRMSVPAMASVMTFMGVSWCSR
jgi:hypothetical protein